MANKKDLHVGDKVTFLRSHDKAVSMSGTIVKLHPEGVPCVDVQIDGHEDKNFFETAHVDDVTVTKSAAPAAKQEPAKG